MEKESSSVRDRLLARLPQPEDLAAYRKEVASGLEKSEKALRRQKWISVALWIYAVAFMTIPLTMGWLRLDTRGGATFAIAAFFLLVTAATQLVNGVTSMNGTLILKEVKQVQLQVLELQAFLQKSAGQ
jgi:hypothetical protein